jgi:hypothetical protein
MFGLPVAVESNEAVFNLILLYGINSLSAKCVLAGKKLVATYSIST